MSDQENAPTTPKSPQLREGILKVVTDWTESHESEQFEAQADEIMRLVTSEIEKAETAARIDELKEAQKAWLNTSLVSHMDDRLAQLDKGVEEKL